MRYLHADVALPAAPLLRRPWLASDPASRLVVVLRAADGVVIHAADHASGGAHVSCGKVGGVSAAAMPAPASAQVLA